MAEQTANVAAAPAVPAIPNDMALLYSMVQLLMEEKADMLVEKKEAKRVKGLRDESRRKLSQYNVAEEIAKQRICTHLKGGKGPKNAKIDYALYHHTFPDATSYIRCQICGMKWRRGDTDENLTRYGQVVENHTGIGWKQAIRLLSESTNTPTTSEIPMQVRAAVTE